MRTQAVAMVARVHDDRVITQAASLQTGENRAGGAKAKRAVEAGYDAVVVAGGDGTIFDVIQGLAGSR